MPTCKRPQQRGVKQEKNGAGALIQADKDIYVCVCVCVRLPQEERLLRDRVGGMGGALEMDLSEARGCALHH